MTERHVAMTSHDLEAQISAAEASVIQRDLRVGIYLHEAGESLRAAATRGAVVGAVGAATWFVTRWWRERSDAREPVAAAARRARRRAGRMRLPWARALSVAWPLVPLSLRQGLDAQLASLLSVVVPAAAVAKVATPAVEPPPTAAGFEPARYTGLWHEIARIPDSKSDEGPSGEAVVRDVWMRIEAGEGTTKVTHHSVGADGAESVFEGELRQAAAQDDPAKLQLHFGARALRWLPVGWTDQWVLHVESDAAGDYSSAVVAAPDRSGLRLLARAPVAQGEKLERLIRWLSAQGFDAEALVRTPPATPEG